MPRPFDTNYRRRVGTLNENAGENQDAKVMERSLKDRGLSNNSNSNSNSKSKSNKPDLLLRNKNVNQVMNQQKLDALKDKGKQRIDTPKKPITKKEQKTKSTVSLKRPASEGTLPIPKRTEIEHSYPHEEELPYVPDDISPLDLDLFDGTINMNTYETTNQRLDDHDTPIHELESFPVTKRRFQQNNTTIDDTPLSTSFKTVDDMDDSLSQDFTFTLHQPQNDDTPTCFPSEIEFCPSPEKELPFEPEVDQVDLSVFTHAINVSAYDLSSYFDDQVDFPNDLYDDEDLVSSFMDECGITLDDISIFISRANTSIDTLCNQDEEEIDYDEIPFSNHFMEELPLVN